jgi:osmotically inducible lipoprotein OsmB
VQRLPVLAAACVILLSACSDMSRTQQRTLSGAAIGAGVGTVGTAMTGGCVSCGAAIGAGIGAGAGYVIDRMEK